MNEEDAIKMHEAQPEAKGVVCPYCEKTDKQWSDEELRRGKRAYRLTAGVEYHCMPAFYLAS